jgi:hypothetical protein
MDRLILANPALREQLLDRRHDLELAARIQRGLRPIAHARLDGWEIAYHYEPAGSRASSTPSV